MTRFSPLHLVLMVVFLAAASAPSQTSGGVEILLAKARSLEARGRMDLAVQNWRKVLLVDPNHTEALAGMARSAKQNGQTGDEHSYLDRLRKVNPDDPAIAAVESLRVFTPEERGRLDEAGRLAMQHKPDEAMKIYREVLGDQQPPPGKWAQPFYETEAASTGGKERAISQLRQLSARNPNQEAYRLWLASLLSYDRATRMEAFQLFQSIKDPGTAEQARAPWRQTLLWEKENPEALAAMEAYLQRYPDPDLQPAAAALRSKVQQNVADSNREQGFKALRTKNLDTATARFSEVLRQSPNDIGAIVGLGYARIDQKRFSEALSLFDHARSLAPQRQDVREGYDSARFSLAMERGAAAQERNQLQDALLAYQEGLSLRSLDTGALLGLANTLVRERKFAEAEARFQQVLHQFPSNADATAGLGFVRLNQGRFDEAQTLFAKARKLDPARKDIVQGYQNAEFWGIMNQAASALEQHRTKDAIAAYQHAVELNPDDRDALRGLANASARSGDFPLAAKTYYRLTAADPADESSWLGLIQAQLGEQAPQDAISTSQRIPSTVKQRMESHSEYLSQMALVYYSANDPGDGDQALRRAMQMARNSDNGDAVGLRLQIAARFLDQGKPERAIEIYHNTALTHPNDHAAWEALVGVYTRVADFSEAIEAVRSMPQRAYDAAVKDTGFLNSIAVLYSAQGQCTEAEDFLNRSLALDQRAGHEPDPGAQLQLADIWMREHNYGNARDLYHEIVTRNPDSAAAWRGYLAVIHQQRADRALVAEVPRIPSAVRTQLETDPDFLVLEASAWSSAGKHEEAVPLLQQARSRYTAQHKLPPAVLDIQTAWTMLAVSVDAPGLGNLLSAAKRRSGLTVQQRDALEEIWSTWTVRRADRASEADPKLAFSILSEAGREYPADRNIHVALASLYLKHHDKQQALDVLQTWGMTGAQAGDFRLAAGAAMSAHKNDLADQFLHRGLERFPHDPEMMHMAARQDIARGNYDEGERELQSALLALREQDSSMLQKKNVLLPTVEEKADISSAAAGSTLLARDGSGSSPSAPPCKPEAVGSAAGQALIRPISLVYISRTRDFDGQNSPAGQQTQPSSAQDRAQDQVQKQDQHHDQKEQMEDEVESVDNRNTPVVSSGGTDSGRVGDPGIDRLIISDTLLGGAYTASNRVRFGVEGHGVFAYSGTPDGTSPLIFGTLPAWATFGEQSKIGYSGLAQLSTDTFGMAVGTSPQGFAVHNIIGGLRYRPLNGWFALVAMRDSVKDSLLSYAGALDPGTGIRWGGIVSNAVTARFDSAPSTNIHYKRIGEYASASYAFIQGQNVPDNWSAAGNAGVYWQMVPGLTLGVNVNGMHYDKDLKSFSFGQGGYFSPQQFYLGSIPISWYARRPRFEYEVKFSGGLQHLHEDGSPFYPVLPASASVTQGEYASNDSTAANYDANVRLGYRVTPHLYFDTFATANNSRNYYTQSAGFNLRFMIDRIPTSTDLHVDSIPDWTGKQAFSIR